MPRTTMPKPDAEIAAGLAEITRLEIFRVVAGRIVEACNCGYEQGAWM